MQPFMVHYTASKHAVTGMARAFAAELGRHSIRVNSVHPGAVNTLMGGGDMIGSLGRAIETYPQLAQMITPFLPTWAAAPEDIADAGVLAGQRGIEKRYGSGDLDRSGDDAVLSQPMNRTIDSATAAGLSEPSISTVTVTVACTAPPS